MSEKSAPSARLALGSASLRNGPTLIGTSLTELARQCAVSSSRTAATRNLLNTAKVMEDNPIALRMKELETLEKVTETIDKISVYGGLDSVLKDLVKIRA